MVHVQNMSKETLSFSVKRGGPCGTVGWGARTPAAATRLDGTHEPTHQGAVITAVGRLLSIGSPLRISPATRLLALCSEVDNCPGAEVVLVLEAQTGRTVS